MTSQMLFPISYQPAQTHIRPSCTWTTTEASISSLIPPFPLPVLQTVSWRTLEQIFVAGLYRWPSKENCKEDAEKRLNVKIISFLFFIIQLEGSSMELLHEKFKSVKKNMAGIMKRISTETMWSLHFRDPLGGKYRGWLRNRLWSYRL